VSAEATLEPEKYLAGLNPVQREAVVVGRSLVAAHRVGVGEAPQ